MAKKRVYEIAKEVGLSNKEVVDRLQEMGFDVKSHSSSLEEIEAESALARLRGDAPAVEEPKKAVSAVGVVRRRRKRTTEDGEVVTTTRVVPGDEANTEEVLSTQGVEAVAEVEEAEAETGYDAEGYESEADEAEGYESEAAESDAEYEAAEYEGTEAAAEGEAVQAAQGEAVEAAAEGEAAEGEASAEAGTAAAEQPKLTEPTATQAVVISRPLIPVAPKVPPGPRTPAGSRRIGPVKEYQVVTDSLGRGREFVDVTKDKAGKKKTPGGQRRAKEAFTKRELITLARDRAYIPVRGRKKRPTKKGKKTEVTVAAEHKRVIKVEETITVSELAKQMGVRLNDMIRKLMQMGSPASANQSLDVETASLAAEEFGFRIEKIGLELEQIIDTGGEIDESDLVRRPPVITVMGHVDHGKTSLLDYIRHSRVAAKEAGGITQHVGAYSVPVGGSSITFIDTPGHEAFTAMRARGAQITDIVILVVAADDSVMPQTIEAIAHAREAKVPVIVAVNKCDLPQANPERVRQNLTEHNLIPEEWGGDIIVVNVSAKTGDGVDKLLEMIDLQAEMLELRANPNRAAEGRVIEARIERGRGAVATLLVQEGVLKRGDFVFSGSTIGKVKVLTDDQRKVVKEIGPGFPAEIQGLDGVPAAGDAFYVVSDEKAARELAAKAAEQKRSDGLAGDARMAKGGSLEDILAKMKGSEAPEQKELKVVLRADVQGTLEAVAATLEKLATEKVKVTIIQKAVGAISESDVMLVTASGGMIVGFNTKADPKAKKLAEHEKIEIRTYDVIYNAVDDIKLAMAGMLDVVRKENNIGRAEVRDVFRIRGKGAIAGCAVVDGKILRSAWVRVLRGDAPIFEGKLDGLKRFKEDVKEVPNGMECGVSIANFNDVQAGDILVAFEVEEVRPSL
ncbi:MAG: translation initiation factor IF-2 [Deltaproteobacteria bacterium]|nr:translation initiation factor IF-2 [Deltaproteobacteria bacterium]